ncbi:MAG: acyl carrier protein [Deltaproteobacteria bacterium]|nr:acyl carrier protein [Deltaproteobacteria bacterium]
MENNLKRIMSDVLEIGADQINEESSMETIASWDSLKHMELMVAIEENFDIPMLSMDEIVEMTRFSAIIGILQSKKP